HAQTGRGGQAGGVEDVLGGEGNSVQPAEVARGLVAAVRRPSLFDRALGGGEDDGVEARVDGVDVLEVRADDFHGGQLSGGDLARQPPGRRPDYISHLSFPGERL